MARTALSTALLSIALVSAAVACGGSETSSPPPKTSNDSVPANSVSEERLKGNEQPGAPKPIAQKQEDPTQPVVTSMSSGGAAPAASAEPKSSPSSSSGGAPEPSPKGGGGKVGRAECDKIYDKGMELEIASNPQLAGAGPDVIALAKQMAKDKHGAPPCDATRAQYNCAVAATTVAKWKSCLK